MHHVDLRRDPAQRQRPVHRGIAAAGNHHPAAAEILPPAHVIVNAAARFIRRQPRQRRPVRPERARAGGDQHRFRRHRIARVGRQRERALAAAQPLHPPPEQARHSEGRNLLLQPRHQFGRLDRRMRRNVVDRLFRIKRRALPARRVQRVDQQAIQLQHPAFEGREQPHRPRPDNSDICPQRSRFGHRHTHPPSFSRA
jgi:hypothetical protein